VHVAAVPFRIYRYAAPWTNRDLATLKSLGLERGRDFEVFPLTALRARVPKGTQVVLISSNSVGSPRAANQESDPVVQENLEHFVRTGGVLIVDLADNLYDGGYLVPGAEGTPNPIFPPDDRCGDATLTAAAIGPDGVLRTPDDHPLVLGPDGIAGTHDDLTNRNIDLSRNSCYVAHGSLRDGIALPSSTTFLMTAPFGRGPRSIVGEFCLGGGRVIADTVTKEFIGQRPFGREPSNFLRNLFAYALGPAQAHCHHA
jgi:hypothetical protein